MQVKDTALLEKLAVMQVKDTTFLEKCAAMQVKDNSLLVKSSGHASEGYCPLSEI